MMSAWNETCKIYPPDPERGSCTSVEKVEDSRLTNIYFACRAVLVTHREPCIYWDRSDSIYIKFLLSLSAMYFVLMWRISHVWCLTMMKYWVFHYLNIPVVARSTFRKIIRVSEDRYSWKYGYFSSDPQIFPKTCKRFGGLHQHRCQGRERQWYPGCQLGCICRTLDHSGTCA